MYISTIFNQLLALVPQWRFNAFVGQHQADRYVKKLTAWNQFVAMLYAQATGKESLREIETGLSLHSGSWYHLGISSVSRSSLSDANSRRNPAIFESLFYEILDRCVKVTPASNKFSFKNPLYALDSTTVSLCLSLFDWAKCSKQKGALKIHSLLNLRSSVPELIVMTEGKRADITTAQGMNIHLEKEGILVFDRGYIDYEWWKRIDENGWYFVSRTKSSQRIDNVGQHNSPLGNVLSDRKVLIGEFRGIKKYGNKTMRLVRYLDKETGKTYQYLTNNFELKGEEIALIYKERWQIELFFKWIKQNLKIKTFLGTSKNSVLSQIWVAMILYLLLSYVKFQTKFKKSLLELTRMIREVLMSRSHLLDILSLTPRSLSKLEARDGPQKTLF